MNQLKFMFFVLCCSACFLGICQMTLAEDTSFSNDGFYRTHQKQCKPDGRSYLAEKEVPCYKNPESDVKLLPLGKGKGVVIDCTYQTEDANWGLIRFVSDRENPLQKKDGWVRLEDLTFQEDVISFYREYKEEIDNLEIQDSFQDVREGVQGDIVMWSYPCSGRTVGTLPKEKYPDDGVIQAGLCYQDSQGRYWMLLSGYQTEQGYENFAICLSEPENDKIPEDKELTLTKPVTEGKRGKQASVKGWLFPLLGVLAVCLLSGVIGIKCKKRCRGA